MTQEERAMLLKRIEKRIKRTVRDIEDLKEVTKPVSPENAIGRLSRMDAINNKSVNEASLRSAEERLKALRYAYDHVDDPNFGYCERCGGAISIGRLISMPESPRCIKCAER